MKEGDKIFIALLVGQLVYDLLGVIEKMEKNAKEMEKNTKEMEKKAKEKEKEEEKDVEDP